MVSDATPGQVVLCTIRKQTEQAMRGKTRSTTPPWALNQLLASGSCRVLAPFSNGL
ncbi:rCG23459 [Rattus norvegicus]|uniref:RCG23459 n=1 Tax=Rattus norvegicus TaxID=10116 RepID=A6KHE3_RAT|nr:rCG23459 [Rattus norvegicus]